MKQDIPMIHGQLYDAIDYAKLIKLQAEFNSSVETKHDNYKQVVNSRPSYFKQVEINRKDLRK